MDFINMTSTGKATIEVDVREYNWMVLYHKLPKLEDEKGDFVYQMEQANNFKE